MRHREAKVGVEGGIKDPPPAHSAHLQPWQLEETTMAHLDATEEMQTTEDMQTKASLVGHLLSLWWGRGSTNSWENWRKIPYKTRIFLQGSDLAWSIAWSFCVNWKLLSNSFEMVSLKLDKQILLEFNFISITNPKHKFKTIHENINLNSLSL